MSAAAWGASWLGSWGNSWGPLHEVEEDPERYGGGGLRRGRRDIDQDEKLHRDHWEYMDWLRERDRPSPPDEIKQPDRAAPEVISADAKSVGAAVIDRAMRGTIKPREVGPPAAVIPAGMSPLLLAALALLIEEADD